MLGVLVFLFFLCFFALMYTEKNEKRGGARQANRGKMGKKTERVKGETAALCQKHKEN